MVEGRWIGDDEVSVLKNPTRQQFMEEYNSLNELLSGGPDPDEEDVDAQDRVEAVKGFLDIDGTLYIFDSLAFIHQQVKWRLGLGDIALGLTLTEVRIGPDTGQQTAWTAIRASRSLRAIYGASPTVVFQTKG